MAELNQVATLICDFSNISLSEFDKSTGGEPYYIADCECVITFDGKTALAEIKWNDIILGSEKIQVSDSKSKRYSFDSS
jgi:hypothetical protein